LPDFVYFNHSIHVTKGVGCNDCHGPVGPDATHVPAGIAADGVVPQLPPRAEKFLRPREQVFNMRYQQPTTSSPIEIDGTSYTDRIRSAQRW